MITNPNSLVLIGQLATALCWGKSSLCKTKIKNRVKSSLTDELFENSFLPGLASSRFFSVKYGPSLNVRPGGFDKLLSGFDIVTGDVLSILIKNIPFGSSNDPTLFVDELNAFYEGRGEDKFVSFIGKQGASFLLKVEMPILDTYKLIYLPYGDGLIIKNPNAGSIPTISNISFPSVMVFNGMPGIPNWGKPVTGWTIWGGTLPSGVGVTTPYKAPIEEQQQEQTSSQNGSEDTEEDAPGFPLLTTLLIATYFVLG